MNRPPLSIITASAGTGKTYRLALEYVRIVLAFYDHKDFTLDNILVLTFTKKATAEIRERIIQHLILLNSTDTDKLKERDSLLKALYNKTESVVFSIREQNIIGSALRDIAADRKLLQVMTIDAYIGSIFRRIVGPMIGIDTFDIDQLSIDKRMPYLLDHLMRSGIRGQLDKLLRRKVSPSLDSYRQLFSNLIENRWIYYLIVSQTGKPGTDCLSYQMLMSDSSIATSTLERAKDILQQMLEHMDSLFPQEELTGLYKKELKALFTVLPTSNMDLLQALQAMCIDPDSCRKLFKVAAKPLFNGNKFRSKNLADAKELQIHLHQALRTALADYLVNTLFLPEQEELFSIWKLILDEYDRLIYKYKNMTYNDISWLTLDALFRGEDADFDLKKPNIATEFYLFLAHRSRFILIDEFQDTSLMQFSILKPIIEEITSGQGSKDFGGMVVVGDEKQSIFGWRGGERKLLLNLSEIFPPLKGIKPEILDRSFRSSPAMMEFINSLFLYEGIHSYLAERNLEWTYTPIQSAVTDFKDTVIEFKAIAHSASTGENNVNAIMRDFVVNSIKPVVDANPTEEIAIICRKSRELATLQQVLEEAGLTSIFQPSSPLVEHAWVYPLISWLRFLAYRDWLDLMAVLRSNYFMLKSKPLKLLTDILSEATNLDVEPDLSSVPLADLLYKRSLAPLESLSSACLDIVDGRFDLMQPTERDLLNIHAFISLLQDFELSTSDRDKSIPAFLDYLDDNATQDILKQVAVEGRGSLQLLTIHKSKGLQFDRVFVFYDLSGGSGNDFGKLSIYLDYASADFQQLNDYALTYHYRDIIAQSSYSSLVDKEKNRELLEELNNLYVAYTRAKTGLHICMTYRGKDSWDEYRDETEMNIAGLPHLLADAARDFYRQKEIELSPTGSYVFSESASQSLVLPAAEEVPEAPVTTEIQMHLPPRIFDPFSGIEANAPDSHIDMKKVWLIDRHNLIGDLVHYYLRFLFRNTPEEHKVATRQCFKRYGSIITQRRMLEIIEILKERMPVDKIFPSGYDKVFTEFTFYGTGKEMRLDRLLLDTQGNRALILDYKTGGIERHEQLEEYRNALLNIKHIREAGYDVDIQYVPIDLRLLEINK